MSARTVTLSMGLFVFLLAGIAAAGSPLDGFVPLPAGSLGDGRFQFEAFELLDHPVTNREYKRFVDATGFAAPLHWSEGKIPAGKEDYPVIFVNRRDVAAFCAWLTKEEGRICRLPTLAEFEYAQRGGLVGKRYPWGDDAPEGKANFDDNGSRRFDRWQDYLQPARWGVANGFKLYGMAGNVCQMVTAVDEPGVMKYKYRIENRVDLEASIMGGSWAKSKTFLACGDCVRFSGGVRQPDLGFRIVRQPLGSNWSVKSRRLTALPLGGGKILLSWSLLPGDAASTAFHVYRATERTHAGARITTAPITAETNFVDTGLKDGVRYQYYVREVDAKGNEAARSEWCGITPAEKANDVIAVFQPICRNAAGSNLAPVFGDLHGDGSLDCVLRIDNGNQEMSQDPGFPAQLEAFTSYGRSLWRKDICWHDHCFGSANNNPFNVWDMDGDGKAEVITRLQEGDDVFVAILDGMTGKVLRRAPWPPMATDFVKSSTRIHMAIAYLDGVHPAVITQTGVYENEIIAAFDAQLNPLWQFKSFAETNGSGSHKIEVADVDGDGRQEVFHGTTCLNSDGTLRWSLYKMHPDIVNIRDHMPDHPGLEVFYLVETNPYAGAYMVDASTGAILWKSNRDDDPAWTHGHSGWTADIWDGSPGMECVCNRAGHADSNFILFSANGRRIMEQFPVQRPLEWDGDPTCELIDLSTFTIGDFDGQRIVPKPDGQPQRLAKGWLLAAADLCGDFRDELVVANKGPTGEPQISVIMASTPVGKRYVTARRTLDYRLWLARNIGGGYGCFYTQPLQAAP